VAGSHVAAGFREDRQNVIGQAPGAALCGSGDLHRDGNRNRFSCVVSGMGRDGDRSVVMGGDLSGAVDAGAFRIRTAPFDVLANLFAQFALSLALQKQLSEVPAPEITPFFGNRMAAGESARLA